MEYAVGRALAELAQDHELALSVHAPLFAFPGISTQRRTKLALGTLDHSAGIAKAAGAEVIVFHPGFWLGRTPEQTIDDVVASLRSLRERLEGKDRAAVRDRGDGPGQRARSIDDVIEISARLDWVRPVIDFAHARDHGRRVHRRRRLRRRARGRRRCARAGTPFHIHFSDIAYANRNETKHLPYGDGTLRAEPIRDALARFHRPATVITNRPTSGPHQAIKAVLEAQAGASAAS